MRLAALFLCAASLLPVLAVAQETSPPEPAATPLESYVVEITEIQVSPEAARSLPSKQLAEALEQLKNDDKIERSETVRMSVLSHQESTVMFSKQTSVTQGVTLSREGRARNTVSLRIGTMVQVSAQPRADQVFLKLKYEASRLGAEVPEDAAPDIESITYSSGLLVRPGTPTVVAASTAEKGVFLLVSIVE